MAQAAFFLPGLLCRLHPPEGWTFALPLRPGRGLEMCCCPREGSIIGSLASTCPGLPCTRPPPTCTWSTPLKARIPSQACRQHQISARCVTRFPSSFSVEICHPLSILFPKHSTLKVYVEHSLRSHKDEVVVGWGGKEQVPERRPLRIATRTTAGTNVECQNICFPSYLPTCPILIPGWWTWFLIYLGPHSNAVRLRNSPRSPSQAS